MLLIKPIALENIAREMGESNSGPQLVDFLKECNVPDGYIEYPNTKWRMLKDTFVALVNSKDDAENKLLFTVFEEFTHPLRFNGDADKSQEWRDLISSQLRYDGYCFWDMHIVNLREIPDEVEEDPLAELDERLRQRKTNITKTLEPPHIQEQTHVQHAPVTVNVNNIMPDTLPRVDQKGMYMFKELQIDLFGRVLRNVTNDKQEELAGFNYQFLKILIDAGGELVEYETIAEAIRGDTVTKLNKKEVMDRKGTFIRMLKDRLQLSETTIEELVQGKEGYRINRKIYE